MAEGFLESDKKSMTMEEVGEEYFEDLVSRSLFQKSSEDDSNFLMHDLVHDLAMYVSCGFCFGLDDGNDLHSLPKHTRHSLPKHTRHLSYRRNFVDFGGICSDAKYLRTLIVSNSYDHIVLALESLWTSGRYLRVLVFDGRQLSSIPDTITNLIHLRYLDLSYTPIRELPASICSLYNLQTLLSWCHKLTILPKNMEMLINLRHLDIYGTPLKEMNFQVKSMKSLLTLSHMVVGCRDRGINIKELKHVQPFIGNLEISRIENVGDANVALEADLKGKEEIRLLCLNWSNGSDSNATSSEREREILGSLQPHTNVRELRIDNYRGTIFPDWVGHDSFSNIVKIRLLNCKSCCILPPLGKLPCLKVLKIMRFDSLELVGDELYGNSSSGASFRSLEKLNMLEMRQWKEWSFGGDGTLVFPNLKRLQLWHCTELRRLRLPNTSDACHQHADSLSKLEILEIVGCQKLMHWDLHRLSLLKRLKIHFWEGDSFPGDGILLPTTLDTLRISDSRNLLALNGEAFQQLTNLKELYIHKCPELQCLPEEGLPASLSVLEVWECHPLLEQRCEKDKGQDWRKIAHIPKVRISSFNP